MSDFAKRNAAEIRDIEELQEEDAKTSAYQAIVDTEALKKKQGFDFWCRFRDFVVAKCQETNEELGKTYYEIDDKTFDTKLQVTKQNPTGNLLLEYFPDSHSVRYDSGLCVGQYTISVEEETGQLVLLNKAYPQNNALDLEPLAEWLLVSCLAKAQF